MKTVYIIHGWDGSPDEDMHSWLRQQLESKGLKVVAPEMPHPSAPSIKDWVEKLEKVVNLKEEVYFIGHSIGCQTILRFLERSKKAKARGIVFIAPWMHLENIGNEENKIAGPWLETKIDFDKIKNKIDKITCLFSEDDPWVPLSDKEIFRKRLSAKIIVEKNNGHYMTSDGIVNNKTALDEMLKIIG